MPEETGIIDNTMEVQEALPKFDPGVPFQDQLKVRELFAGYPVQSAVPTDAGFENERRLVDDGANYKLYVYRDGFWRLIGSTLFVESALANIVEDTTPQLGGDLDLNGKNLDFPSTPNISDVLDEDDMASDSAVKLATQQSIKAYVDAVIGESTVFNFGFLEKAINNTTNETISHGLGTTPLLLLFFMTTTSGYNQAVVSIGAGKSSTNRQMIAMIGGSGGHLSDSNASMVLRALNDSGTGVFEADINSVNSSNFVLDFPLNNNVGSSRKIIWVAFG